MVCLRDVSRSPEHAVAHGAVRDIARRPVIVPDSLPLPAVLEALREADDEFACVVDEYGGLAAPSATASCTASASVPSTVTPGMPYALALSENFSEFDCMRMGVE